MVACVEYAGDRRCAIVFFFINCFLTVDRVLLFTYDEIKRSGALHLNHEGMSLDSLGANYESEKMFVWLYAL